MQGFVLQDWVTIQAGTGVNTITQGAPDWLDLSPFQDVMFWLDIATAGGVSAISFQTSPTKDESLFVAMIPGVSMAATGDTPLVVAAYMTAATVPLSRFVRWQITGTPSWNATFRVALAANSPGAQL